METIHTCRYCNKILELTSINFKVEKRTKLGFDSVCRVCRRLERNESRKRKGDEALKKEKAYRETEQYKKYHSKYTIDNIEKAREHSRNRYHKNPEPYLLRSKEQKIRLGDKYGTYQKKYRIDNRDELNIKQKERYVKTVSYTHLTLPTNREV